ncbi:Serine/threonine-protein kinase ATR [Frankliniella fusca]|uniref:Serine/threonine-protein kinase ATR n=1 Tax=Frankliniella fusca TaxID=407009 RepID=A0AAE1GWN8_9NEOP|nr:Serine/threonine-protein kinase ATR [Frankliniella fusca]
MPSQPTEVLPEATQEISPAAAHLVPQDLLPPNYSYHITSIEPLKVYHSQDYDESYMFMAEVRANIKSKVEALEWLKDYTTNTSTDWRVRRNFSENTKCIIFKKGYRCHNNTMAQYRKDKKSAHKKHTECVASVMITVKNFNMARSSDDLLKSYPTEIVLHHCHNHPLEAADSLKHRRPSDDVRKKIEDFFRNWPLTLCSLAYASV